MICSHCGSEVVASAIRCHVCGALAHQGPLRLASSPKLSLLAFALSLLPPTSLLGGILGILARRRADPGAPLRGLATAAIALSLALHLAAGAAFVYLFTFPPPELLLLHRRHLQKEAPELLGQLDGRISAYRSRQGAPPTSFATAGARDLAPRRYALYLGGDSLQPAKGGPYQAPDLAPLTAGREILAAAAADIDADGLLDVWGLFADGAVERLVDDLDPAAPPVRAVLLEPAADHAAGPAPEIDKKDPLAAMKWAVNSAQGNARLSQFPTSRTSCVLQCELKGVAWREGTCLAGSDKHHFVSEDCARVFEVDAVPADTRGWRKTPVVFLYEHTQRLADATAGELVRDESQLMSAAGFFGWVKESIDGAPRYRADGSGIELVTVDGTRWSFGFDGSGFPKAAQKRRAGK